MFKIRKEQKEALAGEFGTVGMLAPCALCLVVQFDEIKGLFVGGYDDGKIRRKGSGAVAQYDPAPKWMTKGASYVPGYFSFDDRGRIYISHKTDGTDDPDTGKWKRSTQGIEITVRVDPPSVPIPAGTTIVWSFEDPDDPTNENPRMHRSAGMILDPNDYAGRIKTGNNADDNDPYQTGKAKPHFAELEPRYPLSGVETPVDPATRKSKVRFNVSDVAGDNYRVRATLKTSPSIRTTVPAETGIMTVWNRIKVEYVKMKSAQDLPLHELPPVFDMAYAQIDVAERREVADEPFLGYSEEGASMFTDDFATKDKGHFHHELEGGWFFIAAALRHRPTKDSEILYDDDATAHGDRIRLLPGKRLQPGSPYVVRVFDRSKIGGAVSNKQNDPNIHIKFHINGSARQIKVRGADGREETVTELGIVPHEFQEPENLLVRFLYANLRDYGFADGEILPIQILTEGDGAYRLGGRAPPRKVGQEEIPAGRVVVFTQAIPLDRVTTYLCHELGHAFNNAHRCGNWDWIDQPNRTSCNMNYWFSFLLNDATPRVPIPWTQNRVSAHFCAQHLRSIRKFHLEDNPGLGWT